MQDNVLPLFLLITQVYNIYGANSTVNITLAESSINLTWPEPDLNTSYDLRYSVSTDPTTVQTGTVVLPNNNETAVEHEISGLYPGQTYFVEIERNGTSIFRKNITTIPLPVSDIQVSMVTSTTAMFTWLPSNASIQDSYQVVLSGNLGLPVLVTSPMATVDGLVSSTTYTVTVFALSHQKMSKASEPFTMNTAPASPESVNAVAMDTQTLNISWTPDSNSTQDDYIVSYTYNVTSIYNEMTVNVSCPTALDLYCEIAMPGVPGQVYEIRVYSKLGTAVSSPQSTLHSTAPLPVSSLTEAESNSTAILLKWSLANNDNPFITSFLIRVTGENGAFEQSVSPLQMQISLTGLNVGTKYNVSIYTSTGYEVSQPLTQTFYTYPAPVSSLTYDSATDATNSTITVHWSIASNATFDYYFLTIKSSGTTDNFNESLKLISGNSSYTFTELTAGAAYIVTIATELGSKSSDALSDTYRTVPNKPSDAILDVVSGTEVKVTWQAPAGLVDHYILTLTTPTGPKIVTETGTSFTFVDLQPGTEYALKMESQSGSLNSEAVDLTFITNPSAVENLRTTLVDSYHIYFAWDPPVNATFDTYLVTIEINRADTQEVSLNSSVTSYKLDDLAPGTLFTISVVTVSSNITSDRLTINVVTSPLSVMDLSAEDWGTGLRVNWSLQNVTGSQSGFLVTYREFPIGKSSYLPPISAIQDELQYTVEIPNLLAGGTYNVVVQVWQNVSGVTAGSAIQQINATTQPKPVENLTVSIEDTTSIRLDWSQAANSIHDYYLVRHRTSLREPSALWVLNSTYIPDLALAGLFPGERYELEVFAVSGNVNSEVQTDSIVLPPLSPPSLSLITNETTASSVKIQWLYNRSATYVEQWQISYHDDVGNDQRDMVPSPATASIVEHTVVGLLAGFKYNMSVRSVVQGVYSSDVHVIAITKPVNNVNLFFHDAEKTSFTIIYSFENIDNFDEIVFTLTETREVIIRTKADEGRRLEFSNLTAGELFTVEVYTVSGEVESEIKTMQAQTLPNNVTMTVTSKSATDISLNLIRPEGGVDKYEVKCYHGTVPVKAVTIDTIEAVVVFEIDQLTPFTEYQCITNTWFGTYSVPSFIAVVTLQAAPSVVQDVVAMETAPTEVKLNWKIPQSQNGYIQLYIITFRGEKEGDVVSGSLNVTASTTSQVFKNFKAGYRYTFEVQGFTIAAGPAGIAVINMKTYKPPYKTGVTNTTAQPRKVSATIVPEDPHKIVFNFSNVFSDKYGEIVSYTVIVSELKDNSYISGVGMLPGWKEARQDRNIKTYQVVSNCTDFFAIDSTCNGRFVLRQKRAVAEADYKMFEIGSETGCEDRTFCNGPLKPDTTYYVALRAYTTMQFTDTPFSEAVKTAAIKVEEPGTNVGGIVGGIIAALVAIAVVIVVVIFVRRRGQTKSNMYRHQPGEHMANRLSLTNRRSCCPVNLADFKNHIAYMKADSDFKYAEQFEDLKEIGRGQPVTHAELPCNRGKNRFTNILPYDHSRVKLLPIDDEEGSDYINANYIPGYRSKREYIVTQGPLPATRDDFWRMLWEQNTRNIVMLTKCIEKGREKCDKYWPTGSDAVFYGDLQVAVLNETLFPDWTITEFRVSLGEQSRQVRHFHFTSWPDFGVPKKEQVLVRFVRMVREKLIKDAGPIIVHCSAGVGRSGTFVVLDRMLQRIKDHDSVDIFNAVLELRKQRVWMVQTEQQYICIHNCLLCVLEGREDEHVYSNVGHSNIAFEDDEGVDLN
ncbi:tyrosine-protein phosphatase 10D-like [Mya arenaria]|uniref:tyrosine-protein phosphatase 10D-like n=1 Tax=Mya arenaria TaxID=6604 RepID=UPI0022E6B1FA|nr:tyrosine-protein phosphatase 10D-like [Mya arenaria]